MKKRILATLLAMTLTLMVTACGNPVTDQEAAVDQETVAESSEISDEAISEPTLTDKPEQASEAATVDELESTPESTPADEAESASESTSAGEAESASELTSADEAESASEPTPDGETESASELTPASESVLTAELAQEPAEIPAAEEKSVEIPASAEGIDSAVGQKTEEVDAKTAAARAKIAEAEANMDFFSCTPQDYVDAGYLSEETARALMQGMGQPVPEAPAQEELLPEAPAPAVSSDIFGKINNMTDAQYAAVLPILQDMATAALATGTTELDHVRAASQMVYAYAANAVYTTEGNYNKPYGLIFEGVYTCAATCRTTAMVLILMGYPDVTAHNLSQWSHQWVTLTIDGQAGWADGIAGIADYGVYPLYGDGAPGYYEDPVTGLTWY